MIVTRYVLFDVSQCTYFGPYENVDPNRVRSSTKVGSLLTVSESNDMRVLAQIGALPPRVHELQYHLVMDGVIERLLRGISPVHRGRLGQQQIGDLHVYLESLDPRTPRAPDVLTLSSTGPKGPYELLAMSLILETKQTPLEVLFTMRTASKE